MSLIILGDVHLGASTTLGKTAIGSNLNSRIADQVNLLNWTLEQAVNIGSNHIIITGDIFEEPKPHPNIITLFISWIKKCQANDITLHIIVGNHDILRNGNFYTSPLDIVSEAEMDNVFVYTDITSIFIDDIAITLVPFRDRKSFNVESSKEALSILENNIYYELSSIPKEYTKILIGHLALEGSIPIGNEIDDLINELFCPLDFFKGYDYVWMGHIHKPQVLSKNPYIAHIGSMDISNFGEEDHEKCIIIFDSEERDKFKEVIIPTRKLKKIIISVPKETKDTTKYVSDELAKLHFNDELKQSIVRLEIQLTSPELLPINRSLIEKELYDKKVFNISSLTESKKISSVIKKDNAISNMSLEIDPASAVKKWAESQIPEDKKEKFISVALDILKNFKSEEKE